MHQSLNTELFNKIFQEAINQYHIKDNIDQNFVNKYEDSNSIEKLLYKKCWIDTVQWHFEDLIRDPQIAPDKVVELKGRIDASNQDRTDLVEHIDDFLFNLYEQIPLQENYRINTESIGWAIDRLSILNLKVYHWQVETKRNDIKPDNLKKATEKLEILTEQYLFLSNAIDELITDIFAGKATARPFKQMKMYNDPETNPILRKSLNKD